MAAFSYFCSNSMAPQIRSWHHHVSSVLINIVLQIGREICLSHFGFEDFTAVVSKRIFFWDMTTRRHIQEEDILPVKFFPIHIAIQSRSWQHSFTSVPIHRGTKNWSVQNPAISVPIHILYQIGRERSISHYSNPQTLQIRSWLHYFISVPIYRAHKFRSWHHSLSSVLINIVLHIRLESFLSHTFKFKYHFKFGHVSIMYHMFLSTYHHKLGHDVILYHLI
jgi:hypothetical protein